MVEKAEVGILCHGQLALMTGEAANKESISAMALGPGKDSPASFAIPVVDGDYNDPETVRKFSEQVGSFVFDTDHVHTGVLKDLHREGFRIVPNPDHIYTIQNRIRLKQHLKDHNIPTAPWFPAISQDELRDAFTRLGQDVIVKTAEEGYDGRQNVSVSSIPDLEKAWNNLSGKELIVEQRLPLHKELAMMVAQDTYGKRAFYPVVESFHKDGMLEYTFFPALIEKDTEDQIYELGNQILDAFPGTALIGIEGFEVDGKVYVNEVCSRPHNTGHYTIEACATSQFANLARIAAGREMGNIQLLHPYQTVLMRNLNGGDLNDVSDEDFQTVRDHGGILHWYHKSPRPRRKRGHITLFGENRRTLMQNAQAAMKAIHFFAT